MIARYIKYTILFIILLASIKIHATHIVGGEMNYKYLGSNNYEIRLTVYRDCWVGVPPFDNPATVGIFNSSNQLLQVLEMAFRGLDTLPPEINDPCMIPPTDFCYEVTTYIDTVNLPPLIGGYQLSYQRCCRNQNILNIINPTCTGATYYAFIPGPEIVMVNSNPVFIKWPPPFICADKPWIFDHSAIDYDGDSLAYELFQPYEGLNGQCPIIYQNLGPSGINCPNSYNPCPNLPIAPPFTTIVWQSPYSTNDMLGGTPMQINSSTGLVTAVPHLQGYFVIGIKVKEYRQGVLISETKRDFQLIVKPCPSLVVASAAAPSLVCGLNTPVVFTNNSVASSSMGFNWNFGDASTISDTSHVTNPNYLYPGTGSYTATLISYILNKPDCKDSVEIPVLVDNEAVASYISVVDSCSNKVTFNNTSTPNPTNAAWFINSIPTSTLQSFTNSFNNAGTYTVQLIAQTTLGCKDSLVQTIVVPVDSVSINANKTKCVNQTTQLLASGGTSYTWQPTGTLNNSGISNPVSNATTTTVYSVNITQQSLFGKTCISTLTTQVSVNPIDSAKFNIISYPCTDSVKFVNTSTNASSTQNFSWNLGNTTLANVSPIVKTYSVNGTYQTSLLTVNAFGCRDSLVKSFSVFNFTNSIISNDTICRGFSSQLSAQGGTSYTWSPSGSLSNPNVQSPIATPSTTTTYSVIIENTSLQNCIDTLSSIIIVYPKIETNFSYTIGVCANDVQFADSSFTNPVSWQWNFGDGNMSTQQDPLYFYNASNVYTVNLISTNQFGCKDTAQKIVSLPPFDPISVNNSISKCADDTVQLIATGGVKYLWSPAEYLSNPNISNPLAYPTSNTTYSVIVSTLKGTDTCNSVLTTQVTLYPFNYDASLIQVSEDTIVLGQSAVVTLQGFPSANSVIVSPQTHIQYLSNNSFQITPTKSGEYIITAADSGGCRHELRKIYVVVQADNCNESVVFLPTGFTPNDDGINDVLYIRSNFITDVYLTIYDRWGEKLFETKDINIGWNGTFKGKQLDQGVYGYYMTFTCNNGDRSFKKGNITLMR